VRPGGAPRVAWASRNVSLFRQESYASSPWLVAFRGESVYLSAHVDGFDLNAGPVNCYSVSDFLNSLQRGVARRSHHLIGERVPNFEPVNDHFAHSSPLISLSRSVVGPARSGLYKVQSLYASVIAEYIVSIWARARRAALAKCATVQTPLSILPTLIVRMDPT
jgi:hypothetical protein